MTGRGINPDLPMSETIRQRKVTGQVEINKAGRNTTFVVKRAEHRTPIRIEKDYSTLPKWKIPRSKSAQPRKSPMNQSSEFMIVEKPRQPLLIEETLIPQASSNMVKDMDKEKAMFPFLHGDDAPQEKESFDLLAQKIYPKRFSSYGQHKPARRHFVGQHGTEELSSPSAMLESLQDFGPSKNGVFKESSHISLYESTVLRTSRDRSPGPGRGGSVSPGPQISMDFEDEELLSTMDTLRSSATSRADGKHRPAQVKINIPQRLENPVYFKAPPRVDLPESNAAADVMLGKKETKEEEDIKKVPKELNRTSLKDMDTLALACRRGGKTSQAGRAYFNMGVVYDNAGNYDKAIECYKKFLAACRLTKDAAGEALAYNSIGVDYHLMGPKYLQQAIHYYQKHRDIADVPGKYIAHLNLGIAYGDVGESEKSILNHKHALQYSIRLSDQTGESLACANLGVAGSRTGDFAIAKAFMDRHIALTGEEGAIKGKGMVFQQLGTLANTRGDYTEAQRLFNKAVKYSEKTGDRPTVHASRCNIGVAVGNAKLDDYMRTVATQLKNNASKTNATASV